MKIVLASSSAYRRVLLERLRLSFEVVRPEVNEKQFEGESLFPKELAERLAIKKREAVQNRYPDAIVIGSDQVLAFENIGKSALAVRVHQGFGSSNVLGHP